jgi:hypothetical protein
MIANDYANHEDENHYKRAMRDFVVVETNCMEIASDFGRSS